MSTSPPKAVRVAAVVLCAGLTLIALVHAAWAVGVKWLLHASGGGSTDWSVGLGIVSLFVVALCALAIVVTLARAGLRPTRLSDRFVGVGAWVLFVGLAGEVLMAAGRSTPSQRFGNGAVALPLAIAALVVARAHTRPHRDDAPRPPVRRPTTPIAH